MASSKQKIRGQEINVFITIDGVPQAGSFTDVIDFEVIPMFQKQQLKYLGEPRDQFDLQIDGFSFKFSLNEEDNAVYSQLLQPLTDALDAGGVLPKVNLTVITAYRDLAQSTMTQMLLDCKMPPDSFTSGGKNEHGKISISGNCRFHSII